MQEIQLKGYQALIDTQVLRLGTKDSYGTERLKIVPGPQWEGLTITATFVTPMGRTRMVVQTDGCVDVPQEATAQVLTSQNPGKIVFAGVAEGIQRITSDLFYLVTDHSPVEGEATEPTPSEWEQFVSQVDDNADRAEDAAGMADASAIAAKAAAETAAQAAKDAAAEVGNVQSAGTEAVTAVQKAGQQVREEIGTAGNAVQDALRKTGAEQEQAVADAANAKLAEIQAVNARVPLPSPEDAGKTLVVTADGAGYELGTVQVDAYTKAESNARYVPVEAAVRVTGKGIGLARLEPTVPWKMQGLRLCGRSTQEGIPTLENPVPIVSTGEEGQIAVQVTDGGQQSQSLVLSAPNGLLGIPVASGGNWTDDNGQQWLCNVIDFQSGTYTRYIGIGVMDGSKTGGFLSGKMWHLSAEVLTNLLGFVPVMVDGDGALCNILKTECDNYNTTEEYIYISRPGANVAAINSALFTEQTREGFQKFLKEHPITIVARLPSPIETPLSGEELAAYHVLQSCAGNTSVLAAACGIEAAALGDATEILSGIDKKIREAVIAAVALSQ